MIKITTRESEGERETHTNKKTLKFFVSNLEFGIPGNFYQF